MPWGEPYRPTEARSNCELDVAIRKQSQHRLRRGSPRSIASLRGAISQFAFHGAHLALDDGLELDVDDLVVALFAVLGDAGSFEDLRRGRLTEVPEAGGLDLLALLPTLASSTPSSRRSAAETPATDPGPEDDGEGEDRAAAEEVARRAKARAAADQAAAELAAARRRAGEAQGDFRDAEAEARAAEARLREAEDAARKAGVRRDAARAELDAADAAVTVAEEARRLLQAEADGR